MNTQSTKTPHGSHDEAHECLGRMTAVIGTFIREKDWAGLAWFLDQVKSVAIAGAELAVEERGNSTEVH